LAIAAAYQNIERTPEDKRLALVFFFKMISVWRKSLRRSRMERSDITTPSRRIILAGMGALPLLGLSGCAAGGLGFDLTEAIRRLLSLSSQRAFAALLAPNGFFDSNIARIDLPPQLGGQGATNILSAILKSGPIRERLTKQVNRAAEKGAEIAAPMVTQAISSVSIADALSIIKGGPEAATNLLRTSMGDALLNGMIPGIDAGMKLFDNAVVQEALRNATGINLAGLVSDVSGKASNAIFRAIGKEEAAIRANPQATNDPLLIGVFAVAGL
jgi:hypothetical protein